jgi:glycoside/pentoside/hexuronide:cation symporter, GPH family
MSMEQRLSFGYKARFALAELGFTTLRAAMDFFLLFYYTDVAGINPAIASSALLFGKLTWDAINDPLVGWLSDRTRSRFGRRRIFMLVAAVPLALASWIQFSLPQGLDGTAAFFAVLATFWLKDTFVTIGVVPYASLTAEVTHDYQERSSLALFKSINSVIGYIVGAGSVMVLVGLFKSLGLDVRGAWSATGAVFGVIAMTTLLITTFSIKETTKLADEPVAIPAWEGVRLCFKNKPFLTLMAVFLLGQFAFTAQAALLPYLVQYQLGMQDQLTSIMILSLVMTGLFAPIAKLLADRINKGPAYALGLSTAALTFIMAFLFLPQEPTPWVYVVAVVLGISFSTQWVIPFAMMPDVIEYDEKLTAKRREGIYYGLNNFLNKFANALGVAVPGWALASFGYIPNAVQTEQALFGIRFFYAVVPAVAMLICVPILLRYPITRESHAALRQELRERRAAQSSLEG